jgi:Trm5-related predicted tRNA methylase
MQRPDYIEKTNELAELALNEARRILEFGPSQQKIQIIRSVLGVLARQAAAGQDAVATEMRLRMESLMSEMRNVPQLPVVVTDRDFVVEAEIVDES